MENFIFKLKKCDSNHVVKFEVKEGFLKHKDVKGFKLVDKIFDKILKIL